MFNIKKLGLFIFLSVCLVAVANARPTREEPIHTVGDGTTVLVSTLTWTLLPVASTFNKRHGLRVSNPASNTAAMGCILSNGSPSEATTVRPIEIEKGENPIFRIDGKIDLFCFSLHSAPESVHVQEVRQ